MAAKRAREDDEARHAAKKQKKGFQVGPANLPDGTHKRKVQKIKKDLIHKAKIKSSYAKLKVREQPSTRPSIYDRETSQDDNHEPTTTTPPPEPTLEPHPDRQNLLNAPSPSPEPQEPAEHPGKRKKRPRHDTFKPEATIAQKKREEAEARRKAREEAEREKARRIAERERYRKAMARARGEKGGPRKLGRESVVLLEKVRRMVGQK